MPLFMFQLGSAAAYAWRKNKWAARKAASVAAAYRGGRSERQRWKLYDFRLARISHTPCGLRRFKKPTGQEPRAARCGAIGQARRRTLSASSTGPSGRLLADACRVGRLDRISRYALRRPTRHPPRDKRDAGRMEGEKCGRVSGI